MPPVDPERYDLSTSCAGWVTIDLKESDTWKIQLAITINFISSKDVEELCVMYSNSNRIQKSRNPEIVLNIRLFPNEIRKE